MPDDLAARRNLARAQSSQRRSIVYCLIPADLAPALHDLLRRHFADEPTIEVVVQSRRSDRRNAGERRTDAGEPPGGEERRRIRAASGRRVAERRARTLSLDEPPDLPRRARRHADRIAFFERLEPSTQEAEDADTARLVTRIQAGDTDVFSDLYLRYFDRIYAYMHVTLTDFHAAQDATQTVFTKVLEGLPRYERRRQPFRAWLFAIARNAAVDVLRRQNRVEVLAPEELEGAGDKVAPQVELAALDWVSDRDLLIFVERLPIVQRQVLVMRYLLDLPTSEIARALDKTPETIRRTESRAIAFLRDRLDAVGRKAPHRKRIPSLVYRSQAPVLRVRRFQLAFKGPVR